MRIEKVILSFFGIVVGLAVAGIAFYLYQSTKTVSPSSIKSITINHLSPTPTQNIPLIIDSPDDESVVTSKVLTINGKTDPKATVIVNTNDSDVVVSPSQTGNFSLTITLSDSENQILITSVLPTGEEVQKTLTVSYTTEDF